MDPTMLADLVWGALGFLLGSFLTFVTMRDRFGGIEVARCRECGRLWDEHTSMGSCPNGSGGVYVGPRPWRHQ
jgi:hypothetical protein